MPPELRRPPPVDISRWIESMDQRLVPSSVPTRRPVLLGPIRERLARMGRSLARPLAHGTASLVAAVVVISTVGIPAELPTEPTTIPPSQEAMDPRPQPTSAALPRGASADASPALDSLLVSEDVKALRPVDDIQRADAVLTDTPQSSALADTTPDGGGRARTALRPTVR